MRQRYELRPESFDELLAWLSPDRKVAAELYLELRHSLVKIFAWNRCSDPDGMADFVRRELATYKYPRKVEFVRELPKTSTGKIRRSELRRGEFQVS